MRTESAVSHDNNHIFQSGIYQTWHHLDQVFNLLGGNLYNCYFHIFIMTPQIKGYYQNIHPSCLLYPLKLRSGEYDSLSANLEKLVSSL